MGENHSPPSKSIAVWINSPLPRRLIPVMIASTILCMLATHGIIRYGSILAALSGAGGQRILVNPQFKSFGEMVPGATIAADISMFNRTTEKISIQGAKGSCSCGVVGDLPCVIEPGASRIVELRVTAPNEAAPFSGTILLYTDDRITPVITLGYEGYVVQAAATGSPGDVPR